MLLLRAPRRLRPPRPPHILINPLRAPPLLPSNRPHPLYLHIRRMRKDRVNREGGVVIKNGGIIASMANPTGAQKVAGHISLPLALLFRFADSAWRDELLPFAALATNP